MRETLIGRSLAIMLLSGVLALAWIERGSNIASALAAGRPCLGWLVLSPPAGGAPALFLSVYQPRRRALDLVYLPGGARARGEPSLESSYAAALKQGAAPAQAAAIMVQAASEYLAVLAPAVKNYDAFAPWLGECPAISDEPPLDAAQWVLRRLRSPRLGLRALAAAPACDRLLLALELRRLRPQDLHPAWLPEEGQAGAFLSRLIIGAAAAAPERVTVEVLNASARAGIASRAKNILRLLDADVMSVGNAEGAPTRTIVYDRTGRFENAAKVVGMLGCPAASAVTKVDLKRLVDVTVVLAGDCPL